MNTLSLPRRLHSTSWLIGSGQQLASTSEHNSLLMILLNFLLLRAAEGMMSVTHCIANSTFSARQPAYLTVVHLICRRWEEFSLLEANLDVNAAKRLQISL